jgi:hypothetical protein
MSRQETAIGMGSRWLDGLGGPERALGLSPVLVPEILRCPMSALGQLRRGRLLPAADFRNAPKADASQNIGICRDGPEADSCNAANNLVIRFANNHELRKFAGRLPEVILLWPRNGPRSGDGLFNS